MESDKGARAARAQASSSAARKARNAAVSWRGSAPGGVAAPKRSRSSSSEKSRMWAGSTLPKSRAGAGPARRGENWILLPGGPQDIGGQRRGRSVDMLQVNLEDVVAAGRVLFGPAFRPDGQGWRADLRPTYRRRAL